MDFLKDIVKEIGDDYTKLASDIDETEIYVDTGSYIFNALVSGSIFGGVSGNKITAIAGESSTGKTFFSLAVVKNFLDNHPDGYCLYFDTEAAITKSLLESRGIDTSGCSPRWCRGHPAGASRRPCRGCPLRPPCDTAACNRPTCSNCGWAG